MLSILFFRLLITCQHHLSFMDLPSFLSAKDSDLFSEFLSLIGKMAHFETLVLGGYLLCYGSSSRVFSKTCSTLPTIYLPAAIKLYYCLLLCESPVLSTAYMVRMCSSMFFLLSWVGALESTLHGRERTNCLCYKSTCLLRSSSCGNCSFS